MPRTLEEAKAITDKGIEFGVHAWDDPDNDPGNAALVMERAEEIVGLVVKLSAGGSVNDALLEMLHVAGIEPQSDATREAYVRKFGQQPETAPSNGHGEQTLREQQAVVDAAQGATAFGQPATAEEAPQPEMPSIEDVFPGYDDQKVADIKKAILESAASGDLSPEEWARIRAYEAAHEERKTILSLEPVFKAPDPEPSPPGDSRDTGHTESPGDDFARDGRGEEAGVEDLYGGRSQTLAQQERLPIPPAADADRPPVLPIDITAVSDQELSQIATAFHSLFARAQWLISQEEGRERAAEHLEREAERDAYVAAYELHKSAIPEEKRSQPTALEAARKQAEHDAEMSQAVRTWRSRRVRHGIEARELKALSSGYDKSVWRINEELQRRARLQVTRPA